MSFLMEKGADPSDMSTSGFTPLIVASAGGHLGESVRHTTNQTRREGGDGGAEGIGGGCTAVMVVFVVLAAVVKKLLSAKVDVNADHPEGVNALMYAAAGGHLPVVALLLDNGAEVRTHKTHALADAWHGGGAGAGQEVGGCGRWSWVVLSRSPLGW